MISVGSTVKPARKPVQVASRTGHEGGGATAQPQANVNIEHTPINNRIAAHEYIKLSTILRPFCDLSLPITATDFFLE